VYLFRAKGDKLVDLCENKEVTAIEKALTTFFDGLRDLDHKRIYEVFHPDAKSFMYSRNGKIHVRAQRWERYCENIKKSLNHPDNRKVSASIEDIDLSKNIAMVKALLKIEFPTGMIDNVNYYQMSKIDGKWMIMSKVHHGEVIQA
jgi:hypothetical protein